MSSIEDSIVYIFNFVGHLVCHQIPERTLWIGGSYLPVCARDTGVYLGFFVGYLLLFSCRKKACGPPNLWITLFMVAPMIVDAITQLFGFRISTNEIRLLTGVLFGTALSPFLVYSLATVPLSRRLPILRVFLPTDVRLDDKESWLIFQAFGFGLLIDVALFFLINSVVASTDHLFYWLLSTPIIVSVTLHIFILPIFLGISFVVYLRNRFRLRREH